MEVGVRLIGIILRILNFVLAPLFWLRARNTKQISPIRDEILLRSAVNLASAIRKGELTSERIVHAFIARTEEVNILLNAVVDDRCSAALEEARELDGRIERARRERKLEEMFRNKPLLGVPFTVKESCSLAGLSNAVGCLEFAGRKATKDGVAVQRMKEAGGIPLLVSNTPEMCLGWETTNLLSGTTNNPYDLNMTPGGSSGGEIVDEFSAAYIPTSATLSMSDHVVPIMSTIGNGDVRTLWMSDAALLACGASPMSVSSDIAGSIRIPAAFCGVFGHKPSPGIIPIEGHIPTLNDENYSKFLAVGPMSRHAEDLPLLMKVMGGDACDKLDLDTPVDMKDLRVYAVSHAPRSAALGRAAAPVLAALRRAARHLHSRGATLAYDDFKDLDDSVEMSISVFFSMKDIPNMLQDPANPKQDKNLFIELIKYMFGFSTRSLQALGFALIHKTNLFIPQSRTKYYRDKADNFKQHLVELLGSSGVLVCPAHMGTAHAHGRVFVRAAGVAHTMLHNVLGLPATAAPLPRAPRCPPLALQVIAAPNQDRLCLAVAKELEKAFGGWQFPHE